MDVCSDWSGVLVGMHFSLSPQCANVVIIQLELISRTYCAVVFVCGVSFAVLACDVFYFHCLWYSFHELRKNVLFYQQL